MFGRGIKLFKIFGFEIRIDASWLFLLFLVVFTLTSGYFPLHYENLSSGTYIVMGITGALGLFISIILHELSHSLVGRRYGVSMKGISLFMFGGVAQMENESKTPKGEFFMAIAGPLASLVIAGIFYVLSRFANGAGLPVYTHGVLGYLAFINVVLAIFNLLPAFPLDGGRILRSALWAWKNNLRWATHIASDIGAGFGAVMIILGIFAILGQQFIGGLWWCLIGMFLRSISHGSYSQMVVKETLSGEPVKRFMRDDPVTAPSNISIKDLVNDYIYEHHFKMFPVVDDGELKGCVTTQSVKTVPKEEWADKTVADITKKCSQENTISPDADAADALAIINKSGNSRLMVTDNGNLVGIVALKDMLRFLSLKLDLEGSPDDARRLKQQIQGQ